MILDLHPLPAATKTVPLDDIQAVTDFSLDTLAGLADRIARSAGYEQLAYREVELDEVWRLLDASIAEARRTGASAVEVARLRALQTAIMEAHDMVSDDRATQRTADRLRAATAPE